MNPIRVSGYMYSDDGGATFVDGGQLPSPGTELIGTTRYPQVFGDPEVKYLGGCSFIYASIIVKKFSATRAVQTMGIHRSLDCGHTWEGPYEVTPATNPHGAATASGIPRDAADKEFMDVDRETGRVILTWSNFTPFAPGGEDGGTVCLGYANAALRGGARGLFEKSTDEGLTFSGRLRRNSRPGDDRAQWFPWVAVDRDPGRVFVFYYGQGIAKSGHLREV